MTLNPLTFLLPLFLLSLLLSLLLLLPFPPPLTSHSVSLSHGCRSSQYSIFPHLHQGSMLGQFLLLFLPFLAKSISAQNVSL